MGKTDKAMACWAAMTDTSECCGASPIGGVYGPNSWLWLADFGLNLANKAVYQGSKLVPCGTSGLWGYSNEVPAGS